MAATVSTRPALNRVFSFAVTALAAIIFPVFAADCRAEEGTAVISAAQAPLRLDPGGAELALAHGGSPVKVKEVRGDWSKVSVEGWVRNDQLKSSQAQKTGGGGSSGAAVSLVDYTFEELSKSITGTKRAVKLTLTLRNDSAKPITRWKGMMLVQDRLIQGQLGEVILRVPVSDEKAIPAGGSFTSEYFWTEDKSTFQIFSTRTKKSLAISVVDIQAE